MKFKKSLLFVLAAMCAFTLFACGKKSDDTNKTSGKTDIVIWVGSESLVFYQKAVNDYKAVYKEKNGKDFPVGISVKGTDSSSNAATFLLDTEAGADIFTIPHDNLGKLLAGSGAIAPFEDADLVKQIEEQNSEGFKNACYLQAGDGSVEAYYGVPYISQALVYMYSKDDFAGKEEKLASWEGILEVAKEKNKLATAFTGTDGYNFSSFLLAQPYDEATKAVFGDLGTLKIYSKGVQTDCYNYGDDQVAIFKYAQRFVKDANGRKGSVTSSDGWEKDAQNNLILGVVAGAWNYNAFCKAMGGEDKVGVTTLPTFTLTAADAYGKATAGMVFKSGTFADCKVFVKKKNSKNAAYLDDIIAFLSSDKVQEASFKEANNLPASKNVTIDSSNQLAKAQLEQAAYGIPQPFGFNSKYNDFYYSKKMPDIYLAIVQNTDGSYNSDDAILKALQKICWTWTKGYEPDSPEELATWVEKRKSKYEK